jgi:ubiquinone/menaquinone biosynthesis C-methylase UbiE
MTSKIEPVEPKPEDATRSRIRDFWTRNVNAEMLYGKRVSGHDRGRPEYFQDLETQRYRSHRHLQGWIEGMQPGRSVLEIGTGIGMDAWRMARHGLDVTGVDLTEVAVQTAQRRFAAGGVPASFLNADATRLPFRDASFDYVFSFGVLHHAQDTGATIDEVHRVLKPGGEARIMLYHRHSLNELVHRLLGVPFEEKGELCPVVRRFTRAEVRHLFRRFTSVDLHLDFVYGEGYGAVFRLTPRWLYRLLSRSVGWHLMIRATR